MHDSCMTVVCGISNFDTCTTDLNAFPQYMTCFLFSQYLQWGICANMGMKDVADEDIVFRSSTTLKNQLVRPKDPVPPERCGGVVYMLHSDQWNKMYISKTGRPISERIKAHQRDLRRHHPNWDNVQCVDREQHWYTGRNDITRRQC